MLQETLLVGKVELKYARVNRGRRTELETRKVAIEMPISMTIISSRLSLRGFGGENEVYFGSALGISIGISGCSAT